MDGVYLIVRMGQANNRSIVDWEKIREENQQSSQWASTFAKKVTGLRSANLCVTPVRAHNQYGSQVGWKNTCSVDVEVTWSDPGKCPSGYGCSATVRAYSITPTFFENNLIDYASCKWNNGSRVNPKLTSSFQFECCGFIDNEYHCSASNVTSSG